MFYVFLKCFFFHLHQCLSISIFIFYAYFYLTVLLWYIYVYVLTIPEYQKIRKWKEIKNYERDCIVWHRNRAQPSIGIYSLHELFPKQRWNEQKKMRLKIVVAFLIFSSLLRLWYVCVYVYFFLVNGNNTWDSETFKALWLLCTHKCTLKRISSKQL